MRLYAAAFPDITSIYIPCSSGFTDGTTTATSVLREQTGIDLNRFNIQPTNYFDLNDATKQFVVMIDDAQVISGDKLFWTRLIKEFSLFSLIILDSW